MCAQIDVLDAAADPLLALSLRRAYRSHVLTKEVGQRGRALRELYESEGDVGPWVSLLAAKERMVLVAELSALRRHVDGNVRVYFEGDGGPWIGGELCSETRRSLAAELAMVRRRIEACPMPVDFRGDHYFRDVFEREPDAWRVGIGTEARVIAGTLVDRDTEMARHCQGRSVPDRRPPFWNPAARCFFS